MTWITQNWVWVLFAAWMIAMHLFGHGGHGQHSDDRTGEKDVKRLGNNVAGHTSERGFGHHH
jgi:hypothetical protein